MKSDIQLLNRIHKALSGVPPPSSVTISQMDCNDFLRCIKQNSHLFWPSDLGKEQNLNQITSKEDTNVSNKLVDSESKNSAVDRSINSFYQQIKSGSRNLMNAFDACDLSSVERNEQQCCEKSNSDNSEEILSKKKLSRCNSVLDGDTSTLSNFVYSNSNLSLFNDSRESRTTVSVSEASNGEKCSLLNYRTISKCEAAAMEWPEVYAHKAHGIQ